MGLLSAIFTVFGVIAAIVGFVASALSIQAHLREREKERAPPPPIIDPALVKAAGEEDRVLLKFSSKHKDEPGTFEHFVYSLRAPLDPDYQSYFIETPEGTVRVARSQLAVLDVARRFLYFSLLGPALFVMMIIIIPLAGLVGDAILGFMLMAAVLVTISGAMSYAIYLGLRVNQRMRAKHGAALSAAQTYVNYLNKNGILLALEFTQLKSKHLDHPSR